MEPHQPNTIAPRITLPDWGLPLDRAGLEALLRTGLAFMDVGRRYNMDRKQVGRLAQLWNLDGRSLRAGPRSLAVLSPDVAVELVEEVSTRTPLRTAEQLTLGSSARCLWRCRDCGHQWQATVANRALRGSGCPPCARKRNQRRSAGLDVPSIACIRPELVDEFIKNLTRSHLDAHSTPCGSQDRIQWQCCSGHEWTTTARQRAVLRTGCPTCRAGFRTSRLEYEVAELLIAATGLTVHVDHVERRTGKRDVERLDLYVEEIDLLVDLDPARWHKSPQAIKRDARKLMRLFNRRYVRLRSSALGLVNVSLPPGSLARQVVLEQRNEREPTVWLEALLSFLTDIPGHTLAPTALTHQERGEALGRAARRWLDLGGTPRTRSLRSEYPDVAAEFVEVCDRPGLTADDIAPSGDDRVRWRCGTCGHEWFARTANRTALGTGCPPCRYKEGGRAAAHARPGASFADLHPELVPQFVQNLADPDRTLGHLRPNSLDPCLWRCPHCNGPWRATPRDRHRRPNGGCRACHGSRSAATRRRLTIDASRAQQPPSR